MLKKYFIASLFHCFIVFLLITIYLLLFTSPIRAKDYYFPEVKINVQINSDGSFQVNEQRTYKFDGSFSWADLKIPLETINHRPLIISHFSIADESQSYRQSNTNEPGTYTTETANDQFYAKWFYKASNQTKTFNISYKVENGINLHQDIAEFYWKLIGDQWLKNTQKVSGTIVLPGDVKDNLIHCFGHGPLNGKVEIPDKNTCLFRAENLPENKFLEIRLLFDRDLIPNYELLATSYKLADILEEEKRFAEQTEKQKTTVQILTIVLGFIPILGFSVFLKGALAYFRVWKKYGRDLPLPRVNLADKLHEPPSNLAPAMVDCLLKMSKKLSSKVFLSTILGLVLKRVIKIKSSKKVKSGLLGQTTSYDYSLVKVMSAESRSSILLDFEEKMIDFLFRKIGKGGDEVVFDAIKKYCRSHKTSAYNFFQDFQKRVFNQILAQNYLEKESHEKATTFLKKKEIWIGLALMFISLFASIFLGAVFPAVLLGVGFSAFFFILAFLGLLILSIFASYGEKRSEKGRKETAGWLAFKKWLKDYSVTKRYPVDSLVLWEKFLVYGTVLGISTKALSSLPIGFSQPDQQMAFAYYGVGAGANLGSSVASLSSGLTNLSSAISSLSSTFSSSYGASGSGSSGGFSGGGGGGGSGGGGGGGGAG